MPGRLDDERGADSKLGDLLRGEHRGRAEGRRPVELLGARVDADDLPAEGEGGEECRHAHAAEADDHDRVAGLRLAGVEHGAAAGEHCATEERGDLGWHVVVDRDERAGVEHGMGGEAGDAEVVRDIRSPEVQPGPAAEQLALSVGHRSGFARQLASREAAVAFAAAR